MDQPLITVSGQSGTNINFDVTSVGFDTEKKYTVAEFNQALKTANEKWQENWDGISYPSNIVIVTVENLHSDPCSYKINLTDADYNSIQDIVELLPMPTHASVSTEKAIEVLNKAEAPKSKHLVENIPQKQSISNSLKNADPSATRGESRGNAMEQNRQALYSMEREGEMYFFKAPKECSVEDIMKNASFDTLMKLGEQIDKATFSAIDQSEQLTFSVEMNFDTDRALICKVNDGRGGLTLADRNDLDFPGEDVYEVQISREREILREKEYSQSLSETKAAPSAIRTERQNTMSNTKMECTGMVTFAEGNAKAVAQITINNEFAIKGIKVYEGEKGLFVSMPSRKIGSEYQDVVFPITAEARAQLNNAVLETYGKLVESGLEKLPIEKKAPPEKSTSKISVSLHMLDDEKTKAVGQIVIDGSIVVSGVKVRHGTNAQGEEKDFVSMPSYQTQTGEYKEYALPVTKDCYDKVNKAVFGAYETLQKTEYKGVNLSELGTKGEVSSKYSMNNAFAAKLMAELDKQNIPYSARVAPDATTLSVKNADRAAVDKVQKALAEALTAEKKAAQNQQPEQQTQSKPKKTR